MTLEQYIHYLLQFPNMWDNCLIKTILIGWGCDYNDPIKDFIKKTKIWNKIIK